MSEPVSLAVIGMSCMFPKAEHLEAYWNNIKNGVDAITSIPDNSHWKVEDYFHPDPKAPDRTFGQRGGFLPSVDFNPMEFGIAPKDVEATDTTQLLGLIAAKKALQDAGYAQKNYDRSRTSVILGVTGALELVIPLGARLGHPIWRRALKEAGIEETLAEDVVRRISDSYVGWQENSFPGLLGNVAAGRIASRLDLGGTNCVVDAACASSLAALHLASLELSTGQADMVITGGIDTFNDIFMYMCFSKTPALSPTGDAKPFDQASDGTILGEGLGMLVIKRLEDAQRDGDRIYAVIKGIGSSSDGKGNAIYAPRSEGQKEALKRAYEISQVKPETIELLEAHGTGTKVGDIAELQALMDVYRPSGKQGPWVALGSVKSQIGHAKAAAGVAGLIKAIMALQHKTLPPTIKVKQPIEELVSGASPFYINTQKRPWLPIKGSPRRAGVSSFGFGGTNFHCVLEESSAEKTAIDWDGSVEIFALSSDRLDDLCQQLHDLPAQAPWAQVQHRACESRKAFKIAALHRLLLPVHREGSLANLRDSALSMLDKRSDKKTWTLPSGVCYGCGEKQGKAAMLFPGQGSQYVGMLRDLACQFPGMFNALVTANQIFEQQHAEGPRLSDFIYPPPAFGNEAKLCQEEMLKATEIAQPALGATGLGAMAVLSHFGVRGEACAGHSYGELVALCGAGRIEPDGLHLLSNARGRLMAARKGGADRGGMLAVQASQEMLEPILRDLGLSLTIANRNSPNQLVLAGSSNQIEQAAAELGKRSIRAKQLTVSAAFHSPFVADACAPFAQALNTVKWGPGSTPAYANTTAKAYPSDAGAAKELLASQITSPVDFMTEIETMYADGFRTFIEAGAGHVLADLVASILRDKEFDAIALDSSRGSRSGAMDLALALCRIAALGHLVDLTRWESYSPNLEPSIKAGFAIPICGANYRNPVPSRPPLPRASASSALTTMPATSEPARPPQSYQMPVTFQKTESNSPRAAAPSELASALQTAQQGILSLQRLQEQTAQLHQQFLENQEAARRTLETLLIQRRELLGLAPAEAKPLPAAVEPAPLSAIPQPNRPVQLPAKTAGPISTLPQPEPASAGAQAVSTQSVAPVVIAVIAEKTGYPVEMLDLSMGLDVDLGIDSIKRVEIMAALRNRLPNSPEIKPEHLGALQTLADVAAFLSSQSSSAPVAASSTSALVKQPDSHSEVLLRVIAEKTGYPMEMLSLDMGLDSDLGIDSIKRVEIMAALRTQLPEAPEIKPEHLGALQTLKQIVEFLTGQPANETNPTVKAGPDYSKTTAILMSVVAEKTGYPVEMLNLDMGLDSDLGIDSIKRVEIMAALKTQLPEAPEIKPEHLGALQTLKQIADFLCSQPEKDRKPPARPDAMASNVPAKVSDDANGSNPADGLRRQIVRPAQLSSYEQRPLVCLPRNSLIWITEDGSELSAAIEDKLKGRGMRIRRQSARELASSVNKEKPSGLVILWPANGGSDTFVKQAFRLIQIAGPSLRNSSGSGVLVAVSRLDGVFGFGTLNGKGDPISGGLAGLVKTAQHEWPDVNCKALDINPEIPSWLEIAEHVVEEMFYRGPVEVGLSGNKRFSLQVELSPFAVNGSKPVLNEGDVVVVAGGARGITAAVSLHLARTHHPRLILLGRSRLGGEEPDWLKDLDSESDIKRELLAHSKGNNSLKTIEKKYRDITAQREINEQMEKIRAVGANSHYLTVDVRDTAAVERSLAEIRQNYGPICGLVHGAGVLADRKIEDKTEAQFDLVYGTKVEGMQNLLAAATKDNLKLLALFSSYTGRYGRMGQVDYAAANEVLNKIAQVEARRRPQCRVVSFNWGPWNGGMVSDGHRKIFEQEGVGLIEPEAGAQFFVRELSSRDRSVEILAVAPLASGNVKEFHPIPAEVKSLDNVAFEKEVSLASMPCLESHILNGKAVLPAAIMMEWLAHGAVHGNPGMSFHGCENFQVLKGLILEPSLKTVISVLAGQGRMHDGMLSVPVQLTSQEGGRRILHARAEVMLSEAPPEPISGAPIPVIQHNGNGNGFLYQGSRLFHGPHFHGIEKLERCSENDISALVKSAPSPKKWIRHPLRPGWLVDPLVLDSSFQLMILWTWEYRNAASLPCAIRRFRQFAPMFPKNGGRILIQITSAQNALITADIQYCDRQGGLIAIAEGYECVVDSGLQNAFQRNRLMHEQY